MLKKILYRIRSLKLQAKLFLFLGIILIITSISYVLYTQAEQNLVDGVSGVEVSQNNEIMAQKFGFLAFSVFNGDDNGKKNLESAINQYQYNLDVLERGGNFELLEKKIIVKPLQGNSKSKLLEVKQLWEKYRENLLTIITQAPEINQIDSTASAGQTIYSVTRVPNQARRAAMAYIQDNTTGLFTQSSELTDMLWIGFYKAKDYSNTQITFIFLVYSLLFIFVAFQFIRAVVQPIRRVSAAVEKIIKGDFNIRLKYKGADELGNLAQNLNNLSDSLEQSTNFATAIGKYKFDVNLEPKNQADKLAYALLGMRDNLKKINDDNERRTWFNTGLSLFNDILRTQFDKFEDFAYKITYELVEYLNLNQMGFYSLYQKEDGKEFLRLDAAYAYKRRRFEEQSIDLDDGLLAQSVIEKAEIYLLEVPDNYIQISSGLGDAKPKNLFIVPLISEGKIYGVIELASFQKLEEYQKDFIRRIAESVAATIATVRINEQTKHLLANAQEYAQKMQSQEEEMRQNVEELASTQEILAKREKEASEAYHLLLVDYEKKVSEMTRQDRMLNEQKSQLQASLDMAQENQERLERQYEEIKISLEKLKNKESSMAFAIQEKDREIITLRKNIEELKKNMS